MARRVGVLANHGDEREIVAGRVYVVDVEEAGAAARVLAGRRAEIERTGVDRRRKGDRAAVGGVRQVPHVVLQPVGGVLVIELGHQSQGARGGGSIRAEHVAELQRRKSRVVEADAVDLPAERVPAPDAAQVVRADAEAQHVVDPRRAVGGPGEGRAAEHRAVGLEIGLDLLGRRVVGQGHEVPLVGGERPVTAIAWATGSGTVDLQAEPARVVARRAARSELETVPVAAQDGLVAGRLVLDAHQSGKRELVAGEVVSPHVQRAVVRVRVIPDHAAKVESPRTGRRPERHVAPVDDGNVVPRVVGQRVGPLVVVLGHQPERADRAGVQRAEHVAQLAAGKGLVVKANPVDVAAEGVRAPDAAEPVRPDAESRHVVQPVGAQRGPGKGGGEEHRRIGLDVGVNRLGRRVVRQRDELPLFGRKDVGDAFARTAGPRPVDVQSQRPGVPAGAPVLEAEAVGGQHGLVPIRLAALADHGDKGEVVAFGIEFGDVEVPVAGVRILSGHAAQVEVARAGRGAERDAAAVGGVQSVTRVVGQRVGPFVVVLGHQADGAGLAGVRVEHVAELPLGQGPLVELSIVDQPVPAVRAPNAAEPVGADPEGANVGHRGRGREGELGRGQHGRGRDQIRVAPVARRIVTQRGEVPRVDGKAADGRGRAAAPRDVDPQLAVGFPLRLGRPAGVPLETEAVAGQDAAVSAHHHVVLVYQGGEREALVGIDGRGTWNRVDHGAWQPQVLVRCSDIGCGGIAQSGVKPLGIGHGNEGHAAAVGRVVPVAGGVQQPVAGVFVRVFGDQAAHEARAGQRRHLPALRAVLGVHPLWGADDVRDADLVDQAAEAGAAGAARADDQRERVAEAAGVIVCAGGGGVPVEVALLRAAGERGADEVPVAVEAGRRDPVTLVVGAAGGVDADPLAGVAGAPLVLPAGHCVAVLGQNPGVAAGLVGGGPVHPVADRDVVVGVERAVGSARRADAAEVEVAGIAGHARHHAHRARGRAVVGAARGIVEAGAEVPHALVAVRPDARRVLGIGRTRVAVVQVDEVGTGAEVNLGDLDPDCRLPGGAVPLLQLIAEHRAVGVRETHVGAVGVGPAEIEVARVERDQDREVAQVRGPRAVVELDTRAVVPSGKRAGHRKRTGQQHHGHDQQAHKHVHARSHRCIPHLSIG